MHASSIDTDGLVKKLEELEQTATMYGGLVEHTKNLLRAIWDLSQVHRGECEARFLRCALIAAAASR